MTKVYIRVPKGGGKPEHWAHISTNAAGPTGDAEGLLHLKQYDLSWHRHVPKGYPDSNALRLRMKNGDWPELLDMAHVIPAVPDAQYTMLGGGLLVPLPSPGGWINNSRSVTYWDGSTPINPQPYFGTLSPLVIPSSTDVFYAGRDPAEFYPIARVYGEQPTILEDANANSGFTPQLAGARKNWAGWQLNWGADHPLLRPPYYLFPYRLQSSRSVEHVIADIRWVREHHALGSISAAEVHITGSWTFRASSRSATQPLNVDPAQLSVYLTESTGEVPVVQVPIASPGSNVYAAMDPGALVFSLYPVGPIADKRALYEVAGSPVRTWNVLGDANVSQVNQVVSANQGSNPHNGFVWTELHGVIDARIPLSPVDFASTDHLEFTLQTDPLEEDPPEKVDPLDSAASTMLSAAISNVVVNLYR